MLVGEWETKGLSLVQFEVVTRSDVILGGDVLAADYQ